MVTAERPLAINNKSLDGYADIVEKVLCDCARFYAEPDRFRTQTIFDRTGGNFLLLDEGWDGYKRIHRTWVHIEIRDGLIWVHQDGTQEGIAVDLMKSGIPQERIVLAFQHPSHRKYGDFAPG